MVTNVASNINSSGNIVIKKYGIIDMKKICAMLIVALVISSCSSTYLSPSVKYRNSSLDGNEIRNIKVIWNGYHLLKESGPYNVCNWGGGQSFGALFQNEWVKQNLFTFEKFNFPVKK